MFVKRYYGFDIADINRFDEFKKRIFYSMSHEIYGNGGNVEALRNMYFYESEFGTGIKGEWIVTMPDGFQDG